MYNDKRPFELNRLALEKLDGFLSTYRPQKFTVNECGTYCGVLGAFAMSMDSYSDNGFTRRAWAYKYFFGYEVAKYPDRNEVVDLYDFLFRIEWHTLNVADPVAFVRLKVKMLLDGYRPHVWHTETTLIGWKLKSGKLKI